LIEIKDVAGQDLIVISHRSEARRSRSGTTPSAASAETCAGAPRERSDRLYPADAYVMKNVQEFFALTKSLYLWGNVDRPPHNRATLRDRQPVYYRWLGDLFGVQKSV
jgi:hypothetical protein